MKVLDVAVGGGATSALLAAAVGPSGQVWAQGFALEAKSDYLRAPGDPRDQPFFTMEGKLDDKLALRLVKR
jgi:predicted methyltransferase